MQVYVNEQGAVVRKRGGLLKVQKGRKTLRELPMMKVEQLIAVGNVQVTTQAGRKMVNEGIDVVFISNDWRYLYRFDRSESKFSGLRRRQVNLCDNPQRSLEIARAIVVGKINNQRVVLQHRAEQDRRARKALEGMLDMLRQVEHARDLNQLRGFEGKAAAFYFDGVRTFFPQQWRFTKREYFPPPDPANALLSYAYTLLLNQVKTRLHIVGLDPSFGFFHALADDRPSLALDVMEEFRPAISDVVVLSLVMNGELTLDDFEQTGENGLPVRLSAAGRETLISAHEARLSEPVFHPMANGETAYRTAIEYQARQIRWIVDGRATDYHTLQMR